MKKIILIATIFISVMASAFSFSPIKVHENEEYESYFSYDEGALFYVSKDINSIEDSVRVVYNYTDDKGLVYVGAGIGQTVDDLSKEYSKWMNENGVKNMVFAHREYFNDEDYIIDAFLILYPSGEDVLYTEWKLPIYK